MAEVKNLKLKTGIVKRTYKEFLSYKKEFEQQESKVEDMISKGVDEHDIRKQKEVLEETRIMIPDTQRRLQNAIGELKELLESNDNKFEGTEELDLARKALEEAEGAQ